MGPSVEVRGGGSDSWLGQTAPSSRVQWTPSSLNTQGTTSQPSLCPQGYSRPHHCLSISGPPGTAQPLLLTPLSPYSPVSLSPATLWLCSLELAKTASLSSTPSRCSPLILSPDEPRDSFSCQFCGWPLPPPPPTQSLTW